MSNKLIVAIDTASWVDGFYLAAKLHDVCAMVKLGLEFFTANGLGGVKAISTIKREIMLDLKLHDIPNTVAKSIAALAYLTPQLITVHAGGGAAMIVAARDAAEKLSLPQYRPLIIAVTMLTSLTEVDLREMHEMPLEVSVQVSRYAKLAIKAGADGVVCSPQEAKFMREEFGDSIKIITPGVRPAGSDSNDQQRFATPTAAIKAGADWLVVGRPITQASHPQLAAKAINDEIVQALQ